jgi:hypothetical protein
MLLLLLSLSLPLSTSMLAWACAKGGDESKSMSTRAGGELVNVLVPMIDDWVMEEGGGGDESRREDDDDDDEWATGE